MSSHDDPPAPGVLPDSIARHAVRLTDSDEPERRFEGLSVPPELERAVRKRKLQFLAGRYCAARAMAAVEAGPAIGRGFDLPRGPAGEPGWPEGFTGSITHTGDLVWAAAALTADVLAVGIDSEPVLDDDRAARVARIVLRPEEEANDLDLPRGLRTTLAFSAKESLFKLLYRTVGRRFYYADAALVSVRQDGTFDIRVATPLTRDIDAGRMFAGRYTVDGPLVHTALWLPAGAAD